MLRSALLCVVSAATIFMAAPSLAQSIATRMDPASANGAGVISDPGLRLSEHMVADFDGTNSLQIDASHSSGFHYYSGSTAGVAAAPKGDTSQYLAVGAGGQAVFDLRGYTSGGDELASVSAYLGSLDSYNFVELLGVNSDGSINYADPLLSFGGNDLVRLNGGKRNGRLTFGFDDSARIGAILFGSKGIAFEFDSIAISQMRAPAAQLAAAPVPEPASWAMMLGGFGVVGGAMRRRAWRHSLGI